MINAGDFVLIEKGKDEGRIGQVVAVSDFYVTARLDRIKTYPLQIVKKVKIDDVIRLVNREEQWKN